MTEGLWRLFKEPSEEFVCIGTTKMVINEIISEIQKADKIAILPHVSVDGDCLGSSLALAMALDDMGKKVDIILEEKLQELPEYFSFLPGQHFFLGISSILEEDSDDLNTGYEIGLALDTGDLNRLGKRSVIFDRSLKKINIDHHITNTKFAEINFVEPNASSAGEMVYNLLMKMNTEIKKDMATCLYVAIVSDTGGFRYSNTSSSTHKVAGALIDSGVDVADISQKLFETTTLEKVRLTSLMMNELKIYEDGKIAVVTVNNEILQQTGAKEEDSEGIVNLARSIRGIEVAVLFKQKEDLTRVSMRSKKDVDVAKIAGALNGGGHARAAGCTIEAPMDEAISIVLEKIRTELKNME